MTTATAPHTDNPWDEADKATWDDTFRVFGQVDLAISYIVLQRGVGKLPFDPEQHQLSDRLISIEITIIPVVAGRQPTTRNMLSQSREWAKIVNPSIKAFGPGWSAQTLRDKYVEAQMVPSGRKRLDRETRLPIINPDTGKEEEWTTFRFVRVFESEEECVEAAMARFGNRQRANEVADRPFPEDETPTLDVVFSANERATAAQFLPPLLRSCGGDAEKFGKMLADNPMLARHFTLTSPEVMELMLSATTPDETLPF